MGTQALRGHLNVAALLLLLPPAQFWDLWLLRLLSGRGTLHLIAHVLGKTCSTRPNFVPNQEKRKLLHLQVLYVVLPISCIHVVRGRLHSKKLQASAAAVLMIAGCLSWGVP